MESSKLGAQQSFRLVSREDGERYEKTKREKGREARLEGSENYQIGVFGDACTHEGGNGDRWKQALSLSSRGIMRARKMCIFYH